MLKLLLWLFLTTHLLYAVDKVELYASSLVSKNNTVEASGGVTVIYKEYFLTASRAKYNRNNGDLELFDNILMNYNGKSKVLGSYAKLNIAKKEKFFEPFYMLDKESKVWISADNGIVHDKDLDISSGTVSGCNPVDPLWTMDFSSSDYNSESKWLNLYNTRIYLYDIPIFYTPYFGYSLDKTRRTGLLKPTFGISKSEGMYYEQPFYIAEQNWWDLEIRPQTRTNRGNGVYTKFRFVDSKTSHGEFKAGYFKEKDSYFKENNLQNSSHYGYNFKYNNNDFINQWFKTELQGQSGLYIDISHMNDVDYINLASNNSINLSTATQVLSRINMFYNIDKHYIGTYFKYYQDLTLKSNANTLQKLPTLQYHNYLNTLFKDTVLYSVDIKSNNIQREINKKVIQTDINIPITAQTNLFDEFLNISYSANLYGQYSQFNGTQESTTTPIDYRNGYILKNYHKFSASTQLTKAFENLTHVVDIGISYTQNGSESKTGYYQDEKEYCSNLDNQADPLYDKRCEFYNINDIENATQVDFVQYLYDASAKQILYHRLSQNISYGSTRSRYGELENELDYQVSKFLNFYNNLFYNYHKSKLSKIFNKITYKNHGFTIDLSHLYKDTFIPKTVSKPQYTSYLTSGAEYIYNKHYSFGLKYNYDIELQQKKSMEVGFLYQKRCWDFGLRYAENNRPILTTQGKAKSIYDKYIYFSIVLKPFMQANTNSSTFSYKIPSS